MRFSLLLCSSFLLFYSCSSRHEQQKVAEPVVTSPQPASASLRKGEVINAVVCAGDPSQSYALYLPQKFSDSLKIPVVIFFDPHGSGAYPVALYKSWAERFGFVLMGSNNSKNGLQFDETNAIANALISEAVSKYGGNTKNITLAGFSGGAKVALVAASNHPDLNSVVYCGAAMQFDQVQQYPPALGFAGTHDMNYTEVIGSYSALEAKKLFHALVEWKGKHEWPDSSSFENAFYWICFNGMRNGTMRKDQPLIDQYVKSREKAIASAKDVISKGNIYVQLITFLKDLHDDSDFKKELFAVMNSKAFKDQSAKEQSILQAENNLKQNYGQCFESKDLDWWRQEINRMRSIKGAEEPMYQRLLGYLSLASYTYSNNAIKQSNFPAAEHFLILYKLADPENSEQPFLTACMYARQGDAGKAVAALREAIQMGLKDKGKIQAEESFNSIRGNPEYAELVSKL